MSQVYVSLDLETTGLNPKNDEIIEVAGVKFQDKRVVDTFHSLINPHRSLPYRIRVLTGITQADVDCAPSFSAIVAELISFIGPHPIIGHNIPFDLGFLAKKGITVSNPIYDTQELAHILLPKLSSYSLSSLADKFQLSSQHRHRALPDAMLAKDVFLSLLKLMAELDPSIRQEIAYLAERTDWPLGLLFRDLGQARSMAAPTDSAGLPSQRLEELGQAEPLTPGLELEPVDLEMLMTLLTPDGLLARTFPNYEHRREQVRMMREVTRALNNSEHLIVEAGTGIGKSIAYLLPSIFFAIQNNVHVVISTNTINLQEQLTSKDIPNLLQALNSGGNASPIELHAVQVKGRNNYLCLRRWESLRRSEGLSIKEIRLLGRVLTWLSSTGTGDRAELNLTTFELPIWNKICAQADNCLAGQCPYQRRGTCFLYRARRAADYAHLIVVNHALLLSDIAAGTNILPNYSHIIIDEAQHIEAVATHQLGFKVTGRDLIDYLNQLSEEVSGQPNTGFLFEIKGCFRGSKVSSSTQSHIEQLAQGLLPRVKMAQSHVSELFHMLRDFLKGYAEEPDQYEHRLRLTAGIRVQPAWSGVEIGWDNLRLVLTDINDGLSQIYSALDELSEAEILNYENLMLELLALMQLNSERCRQTNSIIANPEPDSICWISLNGGAFSLCAAPLEVGPLLEKLLFASKDCVVLTGATLSTEGTFEYIKERLSFRDTNELLLGAPFDYMRSTMIHIPQDVPEPGKPGYQPLVERIVTDLCRATKGRTLVLFTSHAALRVTHAAIRSLLEEEGILVLGQGVDGSPNQLLSIFKTRPRTVLLGTASFWEGIDVVGEALSVLVIARLPFSVPTDPIFAARSEIFDDAFNQYALPQAILRFKQGFGRLIRSKTDRGVIVVLDRRIEIRGYGAAFLDSLPPCVVKSGLSRNLPEEVAWWLGV